MFSVLLGCLIGVLFYFAVGSVIGPVVFPVCGLVAGLVARKRHVPATVPWAVVMAIAAFVFTVMAGSVLMMAEFAMTMSPGQRWMAFKMTFNPFRLLNGARPDLLAFCGLSALAAVLCLCLRRRSSSPTPAST